MTRSRASRASAVALVVLLVVAGCVAPKGSEGGRRGKRGAVAATLGGARPAGATPGRAEGRAGAVAAEHPRAAEIGVAILAQGGNAVDAAIATAYAVCVLNPSSCGIGGGARIERPFACLNRR